MPPAVRQRKRRSGLELQPPGSTGAFLIFSQILTGRENNENNEKNVLERNGGWRPARYRPPAAKAATGPVAEATIPPTATNYRPIVTASLADYFA